MDSMMRAEVARAVAEAIRDVPSRTPTTTSSTYLSALHVRQRYGVSNMTLHRWLSDEESGFPKPILIGTRRFWVKAELDQWDSSRPRWQAGKPERLVAAEGKANKNRRAALDAANAAKAAERAKTAKAIKRAKKEAGQVAADGSEPELSLG